MTHHERILTPYRGYSQKTDKAELAGNTAKSNERRELGKPDILILFEFNRNPHPNSDRFGVDLHDICSETQIRLLIKNDNRDDIRDVHARAPCTVINGVSFHGRPTRSGLRRNIIAHAFRAHRAWRMGPRTTVAAVTDHQLALSAACPKGAIGIIDDGQGTKVGSCHGGPRG